MSGTGRPPKEERRNPSDVPGRGEWQAAEGVGWQHGEIPQPPDGLKQESLDAWDVFFKSWVAAHWTPDDIPGLRHLIALYDQVERGEYQRATELRLQMDNYGITPKGKQDRRWKPPVDKPTAPARGKDSDRYGHLRSVSNE